MYRNVPRFTPGQELATRYWWNITQLAAAAVQDIFLIVYSAMEDTNNGTKSIEDYCLDNDRYHVTQELQEEGYDKKKFTSNPSEVFFDIQLTRKLMDKALVENEHKNILEKIRKKIRWLSYQRNDICHEILESLEVLKLKLKLGTVKGVLRQLYNLASQFANLSKDTTDAALECFLEELEEHRSVSSEVNGKCSRRFRYRKSRKMIEEDSSEEESSDDTDGTQDSKEKSGSESSQSSQDTSDKDESTDKSEKEESTNSSEKGECGGTELMTRTDDNECENVMEIIYEDENTMEDERNWNSSKYIRVESNQHIHADESTACNFSEQSDLHVSNNMDGSYQEVWGLQGSTAMVQIGLYCSKALRNQYENIQTTLPWGDQLMVFWQKCLCDSHEKKEDVPKAYFVPPKISIRTRSKSLGRKASHYLLQRQRLSRLKYRANKAKSAKEKRSLWHILNQIEMDVPEIQRGVFGNKWEDSIRREEAIIAIENWDTLIAEEEWINEGWGDYEDPPTPPSLHTDSVINQLYTDSFSETTDTSSDIEDSFDSSTNQCTSESLSCTPTPEGPVNCHKKNNNPFTSFVTVSILVSALSASAVLFFMIVATLTTVVLGKVFMASLEILVFLLVLSNFGCVIFIVFIVVKFLLVVLVAIIKIASVPLYLIRYCRMAERRSYRALHSLTYVKRKPLFKK